MIGDVIVWGVLVMVGIWIGGACGVYVFVAQMPEHAKARIFAFALLWPLEVGSLYRQWKLKRRERADGRGDG